MAPTTRSERHRGGTRSRGQPARAASASEARSSTAAAAAAAVGGVADAGAGADVAGATGGVGGSTLRRSSRLSRSETNAEAAADAPGGAAGLPQGAMDGANVAEGDNVEAAPAVAEDAPGAATRVVRLMLVFQEKDEEYARCQLHRKPLGIHAAVPLVVIEGWRQDDPPPWSDFAHRHRSRLHRQLREREARARESQRLALLQETTTTDASAGSTVDLVDGAGEDGGTPRLVGSENSSRATSPSATDDDDDDDADADADADADPAAIANDEEAEYVAGADVAAKEGGKDAVLPEPNINIGNNSEEEVPPYLTDPTTAEEEGDEEAMDYAENEGGPMKVEPWNDLWAKLKASGWTCRPSRGLEIDWHYYQPGMREKKGVVEGKDFFRSARAVQEYIQTTCNGDHGKSDVDIGAQGEIKSFASIATDNAPATGAATRRQGLTDSEGEVPQYSADQTAAEEEGEEEAMDYGEDEGGPIESEATGDDTMGVTATAIQAAAALGQRFVAGNDEMDVPDISMPPTAVEATATGTGTVPSTAQLVSSTDSSRATSPSATEGNCKAMSEEEEEHKLARIEALLAQDNEKSTATCATEIQENDNMDAEGPASGIEFSTDDEQCGSGDNANEDDRHANESTREIAMPIVLDADQEAGQNSTASPRKMREESRVETVTQCGSCANCFVDDCGDCDVCIAKQNSGIGRKRKSDATGTDGTAEMHAMISGETFSSAAKTGTRKSPRNSDKTILDVKEGRQKILDEVQATKSTASSTSRKSKRPSSSVAKASSVQNVEPKKPPARKAKQSPKKLPAKRKAPQKSSDVGSQGQGKGSSAKTKTVTVKAMIGNEEVWTEKKEAALQANSDIANSFSASIVSAAASSEVAADVELEKLEEVEDLPQFPDTGRCTWSFDKTSRVLLASFVFDSGDIKDMDKRDKEFLLRMMERDDITVISEGLAFGFDPDMWKLEFIADLIGDEFCHKVRRFRRQILPMPEGTDADGTEANASYVTYKEKNGYETMKMKDYVLYLNQRGKALERLKLARQDKMPDALNPSNKEDDQIGRDEDEDTFGYTNHNGSERKVNVIDDVLYLTDYDFVKMLPTLFEDLKNNFKLTECLPGGERCMMHCVNANGRPFMGPNLYVTPPASFTHFHQDGHGTVDSGHLCLSGYNEVIMLRRIPEAHKHHALSILNGDDAGSRDALYVLPHDDNGEKPPWPTQDAIDKCKEMGYYPSVFVLRPGQFVHINKGRLHAFRKLAPTTLPSSDCHANLRAQIHKERGAASTTEMLCISVAWDWLYQGFTSEGINREIVSTLECAKLNRQNLCRSLAIPETSILHMARHYVTKREHEIKANNPEAREQPRSFLMYPTSKTASSSVPSSSTNATDPAYFTAATSSSGDQAKSDGKSGLEVEPAPVIKGLLPSLSHIVDRHKAAHDRMQEEGASFNVKMARRPNAHENPDEPGIDPYSNGEFECLLCFEAISNVYMHCNGCETLLHKDFNICVACHAEGKHKCVRQMNPFSNVKRSMLNHVGNNVRDRGRGCSCKQGACKHCGYCQACSCKCHDKFTMQLRFMSIEDEVKLLERVKDAVGNDKLPDDPTLKKLQSEEQKLLENVVLVEDPGEEEEEEENVEMLE